MSVKSEPFSLIFETKACKGQTIKHNGKNMTISTIKEVEITPEGKLLVTGLWKQNYVDQLLQKYGRNR